MNFEIQVKIARPVKEVFRYISNFSNHKEMIKANIDSRQTSRGPIQIGTTMQNTAKFMGMKMEEHFIVTEYIPDKTIAKKSMPGSTFVTGDKMTLEEVNGHTHLNIHVYAEIKGLFKILDGFLQKKVRQSLIADMERLKANFESGKIA